MIQTYLQQLVKGNEPYYLQLAEVLSVDTAKHQCAVHLLHSSEEDILEEVALQVSEDKAGGLVLYPKTGSVVAVDFFSKAKAAVVLFSEVDRMSMDAPEIIINGGDCGGLVKIAPLVEKINTLEQDLNALKTAFKSWVIAPQDGGAALKAAAAKWAAQTLIATQKSDLENNKITHG